MFSNDKESLYIKEIAELKEELQREKAARLEAEEALEKANNEIKELNNRADKLQEKLDEISANEHWKSIVSMDDNTHIKDLPFSTRTKNGLLRANIYTVKDLRDRSLADLYSIRNLGKGSVEEIQRMLKELPDGSIDNTEEHKADIDLGLIREYYKCHDKTLDILGLSVRSFNALKHNGIDLVSQLISLEEVELYNIRNLGSKSIDEILGKRNELIRLVQDKIDTNEITAENISEFSGEDVLKLVKENIAGTEYCQMTYDEILRLFFGTIDPDKLEGYLKSFVEDGDIIEISADTYGLDLPSFEEVVSRFSEGQDKDILLKRLSGLTLEETSADRNITRERIRQLQTKALQRVKVALEREYGVRRFAEDEYKYLFTNYYIDKNIWLDYLKVPLKTYMYLTLMYDKGNGTIEQAIEDAKLPVSQRKALQRYNDKDYVIIGNSRVRRSRTDLEDYIIRKHCTGETSVDDFLRMYDDFLLNHDLGDNEKLISTDDQRRSRENKIAMSRAILYSPGRTFRYYDIDSRDYTELLDTLQLGSYRDTELSTNKWFVSYPHLMKQYDIRNCYELHNLLKKVLGDESDTGIRFSRNPMVYFGQVDRDEEVKDLLFELAPISKDDFVAALSEEYGVDPATVAANWISRIDNYRVGDHYSVDFEKMPEEQLRELDSLLTEELYFIDDIKRIYRRTFPDSDDSLISSFNLSRLGFKSYNNYVVRNKTSATYFREILTGFDIVNYKLYNEKYATITLFYNVLGSLKDEYTVIEFEPYQLIQMSKLEASGITKQMLHDYCDEVFDFADDDYFTIKSIRLQGFESDLDALGFDDWFYASILREDERFSYQRIGGTVVFKKGDENITQALLYSFIVNMSGGMDLDELVSYAEENYGVSTERYKVVEVLKDSDIYYDRIMEKLYPSYDAYFEEI